MSGVGNNRGLVGGDWRGNGNKHKETKVTGKIKDGWGP